MSAGEVLADLPLIDGHCHALLAEAPADIESCLTEADRPNSAWDSPVGLAVRRWCAPALGLPALAPAVHYLRRREELGHGDVTARLMRAAGLSHLLVDTGLHGPELALPTEGRVSEVVRLERVAEDLAASSVAPSAFADAYVDRLGAACRDAVAVKSVAAYRHGLDLDPARPAPAEVAVAAAEWLLGPSRRLDHPVLLRFQTS